MSSMNERVVACIAKPPKERSNEEIDVICPWLTVKTEVFKSTKPEIIKDIIRNCSYVKRFRDDVIIRQGDKGDCFYVILNGRVAIFINTEAVPEDPEEAQAVVDEDSFAEDPRGGKGGGAKGAKKELDRSKYGNCVAHFESGKSFGDLALINKDCVRNASIIADEETDLLEVNRDLFNRCLKAAAEAEFQERITFVNQCSLFSGWAGRFKRQAAMSLRKEFVEYNKPLVIQGDSVDGLKFILTGQAKVIVDSLMHHVQYPQLHLHDDPEDNTKKEVLDIMIELKLASPETVSAAATAAAHSQHLSSADPHGRQRLWEKPIRRQGYQAAEQRLAMRHIEISLVGPGEIIGDIELSMGLSTHSQTIVCTVETSVYVLDARNFERLVNAKRNPKTLVILKSRAEQKLLSRMNRTNGNKQIPLIRNLLNRIAEAREQEAQKEARSHSYSHHHSSSHHPSSHSHSHHYESNRSVSTDGQQIDALFELKRGPIIDLYGPGTVFYRNRMKRQAKLERENKAKDIAIHSNPGYNNRAGVTTATSVASTSNVDGILQIVPQTTTSGDEESNFGGSTTTTRSRHGGVVDWETGSEHLSNLEERIRQWHADMDGMQRARPNSKKAVFGLKRFKAITMSSNPPRLRTGKKIVLRPRNTKGFNDFQAETSPELPQAIEGVEKSNNYFDDNNTSPINTARRTEHQNKDIFVTSIRHNKEGVGVRFRYDSSSESSETDSSRAPSPSNANGGKLVPLRRQQQNKSSTLNVIPFQDVQDGRNLPYQNLQPLYLGKKTTSSSQPVEGVTKVKLVVPDIKKLFSPLARAEANSKRTNRQSQANIAVTTSQQYSMEEYHDLKKMLRKKEMEMISSRYSMAF